MIEIIIVFCVLLLLAYLFDLSSAKTKIPSVILLLLLGWIVRQATVLLKINLPDFTLILPVIGTIGLILIVLEGSLELEIKKSKLGIISKSLLGSLIPLLVLAFLLTFAFMRFGNYSIKSSLLNAIPFCVISSAIAIPSVKNIASKSKEFIIYESSFSDIFGVILFTVIAANDSFSLSSVGNFTLQVLIMLLVSLIATIGLSFLISKIQHHIKFIPIILLIILIYSISKYYHLPALIFILLFGIFIGNINKLNTFRLIDIFKPEELSKEVQKFKELNIEIAFLVRALFFLLFGYLIETKQLLNTNTLLWAAGIVVVLFTIRIIQLKLSKLDLFPLLFIAPRGLITILLFLSIEPIFNIDLVNNSLIIQVIILTAVIMMMGLIFNPKVKKDAEDEETTI